MRHTWPSISPSRRSHGPTSIVPLPSRILFCRAPPDGVSGARPNCCAKESSASFLGAANNKPNIDIAKEFALGIMTGLAGGPLPPNLAAQLFAAYDQKKPDDPNDRTLGSKAWLAALGLT